MHRPHFDKPSKSFLFVKCFWDRLTVLKIFHAKHTPKIIQYRDFNHFDNASFRTDLLQELSIQNVHPGEFEKFKYISSKYSCPYKGKTDEPIMNRCNQSPFMNKHLRKAIMTRTRLLIGKITVLEISLPIKDREIFVLSF